MLTEKMARHLRGTITTKAFTELCPLCGHRLVEAGKTTKTIWSYGGAIVEEVVEYTCTNPLCENHKRKFSPAITIRAPMTRLSKQVLADILVWRRIGKTARWIWKRLGPRRVYIYEGTICQIFNKYRKRLAMRGPEGKDREILDSVRKPIVLIEVIEPKHAPKEYKLLIATEIQSGIPIYSWLIKDEMLDDPGYVLGIISRRLIRPIWKILTDNERLYRAISRIYDPVPSLMFLRPLRADTVVAMLRGTNIASITLLGFFDPRGLERYIANRRILKRSFKDKKKKGAVEFLNSMLEKEFGFDPATCNVTDPEQLSKFLCIVETLDAFEDIYDYEKGMLKAEKKRPWRVRRTVDMLRRYIRDTSRYCIETKDLLGLIEKAVENVGPPWRHKGGPGRKPMYAPEKLTVLAIFGLLVGYGSAAKYAREIKYDAMYPDARYRYGLRFPVRQMLHYVASEKLEEDYLIRVMVEIAEMVHRLWLVRIMFGDERDYVVDGTGLETEHYSLANKDDEKSLRKESVKTYFLAEIKTNTVHGLFVPRGKYTMKDVMESLTRYARPGVTYGDPEFGCSGAIKPLEQRCFDYMMKARDGSMVKKCRDRRRGTRMHYGLRKLGEIIPANMAVRRMVVRAIRDDMRAKEVAANFINHNASVYLYLARPPDGLGVLLIPIARYSVGLISVSQGNSLYDHLPSMYLLQARITNTAAIQSIPIINTMA